jgi:hypothetical protein
MYINLKKISKKRFEECGWKYGGHDDFGYRVFEKIINGIKVYEFCNQDTNKLDYTCIENKLQTPDDLVAIANEVKKLEEK